MHWLIDKIKSIYQGSSKGTLEKERRDIDIDAGFALVDMNRKNYPEWKVFKDYIQGEIAEHVIAAFNAMAEEDIPLVIAHVRQGFFHYKTFIGMEYPEVTLDKKIDNKKPETSSGGDVVYPESVPNLDASKSEPVKT